MIGRLLSSRVGRKSTKFSVIESWLIGLVGCCASAFGLSTIPLFPISFIFHEVNLSELQLWGFLPTENVFTEQEPSPLMWCILIPAFCVALWFAVWKKTFSILLVGMSTMVVCIVFALLVPIYHSIEKGGSSSPGKAPAQEEIVAGEGSVGGPDTGTVKPQGDTIAQSFVWLLATLSMVGFAWVTYRIGLPVLLLVGYSCFLFFGLHLSIAFLLLFWSIIFLLYVSFYIAEDNIREFQSLDDASRRSSLIQATRRWAIIPIVVGLLLFVGNWVTSYLIYYTVFNVTTYRDNAYSDALSNEEHLFATTVERIKGEYPERAGDEDEIKRLAKEDIERIEFEEFRRLSRSEFRDAISANFKRDLDGLNDDVNSAAKKARAETKKRIDDGEDAVIAFHDAAFPPVGDIGALRSQSCRGFLPVGCWIKNALKKKARGVYSRTRQKSIERVRNKVREKGGNLEGDALEALVNGEVKTTQLINRIKERAVDRAAHAFFYFLIFLDCLSIAGFVFMCVKSWIYVFSRVVFGRGTADKVGLIESGLRDPLNYRWKPIVTPDPKSTYSILPNDGFQYLYSWSENPGATRYFDIPQITKCFVARFRHRKLLFSPIDKEERKNKIEFQAGEGHGFVEWTIKAGHAVVFSMPNLVILSKNVKLDNYISARGSSLLFGKIIFTIAQAPEDSDAKIVLRTRGFEGREGATASPTRLLAWHPSLEFTVQGANHFPHIFLTDYNLRPDKPKFIITDFHDGVARGMGAIDLVLFKIRALFLPW